MTDFTIYTVDLDTQRPNPADNTKVLRGDPPRTAFSKYNDLLLALQGNMLHVSNEAPNATVPFMIWLDTSVSPPVERYRNSTNTAWLLSNPLATTNSDGWMSKADKAKLDGVQTNAHLLNRANHTGTQAIDTVSGLQAALNAKASATHTHDAADIASGVLADSRLPGRLRAKPSAITDWNAAVGSGWYQGNGAANAPTTGNFIGTVECHHERWVTQVVHAFDTDSASDTKTYRRESSDSNGTAVWGPWYRLRLSEAEQATLRQVWWDSIAVPMNKVTDLQTTLDAKVAQSDVGSAPNQLSSNQHLGQLAFQDTLAELTVSQHTPDAREGSIWCEVVNGKPTLKTKLNGVVVNLLNPIVDKAVGTSSGNVMEVGAFGLGANILGDSKTITNIDDQSLPTGAYAFSSNSTTGGTRPASYGVMNVLSYRYSAPGNSGNTAMQMAFGTISGGAAITGDGQQEMFTRAFRENAGGWAAWRRYYSTGNTTVDSNGFIKAASPIVNLFSDKIENNDASELASVGFERVSLGAYLLTNCPPLANEGWYLEQPRDRNGNLYHNVEWFYNEIDRTLRIETYERAWNPTTGIYENGAPIDIKVGRFIALRFADSKTQLSEIADEDISQ